MPSYHPTPRQVPGTHASAAARTPHPFHPAAFRLRIRALCASRVLSRISDASVAQLDPSRLSESRSAQRSLIKHFFLFVALASGNVRVVPGGIRCKCTHPANSRRRTGVRQLPRECRARMQMSYFRHERKRARFLRGIYWQLHSRRLDESDRSRFAGTSAAENASRFAPRTTRLSARDLDTKCTGIISSGNVGSKWIFGGVSSPGRPLSN